jgi:hypothetical protein
MSVLFVAVGETNSAGVEYAKANGIAFPIVSDPYRIAGRQYRIQRVPSVFIVNPEGKIGYSSHEDGLVIWNLLEGTPIRQVEFPRRQWLQNVRRGR